MTPMDYLTSILARYNTTPKLLLPFTPAYQAIAPILRAWSALYLRDLSVSGSNAKGTAVAGVADLDLFVSLHSTILSDTTHTLASLYNSLAQRMREEGYTVRRQNVSIGVRHGSTEVDIVPAVKFAGNTTDHWLHVTKSGRDRTKTNVDAHIRRVSTSGRIDEIRLTKIWRKLHGLDFPSIYLEETVINSLSGYRYGNLDTNFLQVLNYLSTNFTNTRVVDPANGANIISDDLTHTEKTAISTMAAISRSRPTWGEIIW